MKKILVVVDMQNDFVNGSLGTQEAQDIVPYVAEKIAAAKKEGTHIICTMDTHRDGYLNTMEGKNLPVKHCLLGTDGWKINGEILDAFGEKIAGRMDHAVRRIRAGEFDGSGNNFVLFRERVGSGCFSVIAKGQFGSPDICREAAECLREYKTPHTAHTGENGSNLEIEIMGLCTDICVVANAIMLKTGFPEAQITVDSRGCAGVTKEKHLAALEVMRSCQIDVV